MIGAQAALWGAAWLAGINAATLVAFGWDKRRARQGGRRIRERTLLGLALAGGSPAALAARRLFRHKTLKQPFGTLLHAICGLHMAGLLWLAVMVVKEY